MNVQTLHEDIVCLSHLRWNSVFQRPHHLMTRWARDRRVFFLEEPVAGRTSGWRRQPCGQSGVQVMTPVLGPEDLHRPVLAQRRLLHQLFVRHSISDYVLWYYTPMAVSFARRLHGRARAVVYDCMDELSGFQGAPPDIKRRERELLSAAHVVFAGGQSLYEARRHIHPNIHAFPSSVDVGHFATARVAQPDPSDQRSIRHPRLGYFGVLDERLDLKLLRGLSRLRPDWQIVLIGPVAKIDPKELPRAANLHYLGPKPYQRLPSYLAGWEVAIMPFARNDATRFISPTKTPEFLAGGKPVVSTSIRDVVRPYGERGLVRIADTPQEFAAAVQQYLRHPAGRRLREADAFLASMSWDSTFAAMRCHIEKASRASSLRGGERAAGMGGRS